MNEEDCDTGPVFITVTYKDKEDYKNLVATLVEQLASTGQFAGIVIVDNSDDKVFFDSMVRYLSSKYDASTAEKFSHAEVSSLFFFRAGTVKIILVEAKRNGGFSYGNNVGLDVSSKYWEPRFYWFINNDCFVDSSFLPAIELYSNRQNVFGGTKVAYASDRDLLQGVGGRYEDFLGRITIEGQGRSVNSFGGEIHNIDYPIGASMIITPDVIEKVGKFCEDYFLYYEELDYAFRARRAGVDIVVCGNSLVFHKVGGAIGTSADSAARSDLSEFHLNRSRLIFSKKHSKNTLYNIYTILRSLKLFAAGRYELSWRVLLLIGSRQ